MMLPVLQGPLVTLRPMTGDDAARIYETMNNWEVIQWLTGPPFPYVIEDANFFIKNRVDAVWAIDLGDGLIGVAGDLPELGYWLGSAHHGYGVMQEAAGLVVHWHFTHATVDLDSGHLVGNEPSRGILLKLGFQDTFPEPHFSTTLNKIVTHQCMTLTRERWQSLRPAAQ